MKLHKLKDAVAIFWFVVLVVLQYNRYYTSVLVLLAIGAVFDAVIVLTDVGDYDIAR